MIESHLVAGRQDLVPGKPLTYGQSITDGCIDWDDDRARARAIGRRGRGKAAGEARQFQGNFRVNQWQRGAYMRAPRQKHALKRDEFRMNRHRALALCLGMIFPENRFTLFRIMP